MQPKRLSFFDPSMGFVHIRSDWDSPDATWIGFWAGPHIDTHQHLDQGGFTLFTRRDLAAGRGVTTAMFPLHLSWYTRTVSSNGILIGDPKKSSGTSSQVWGAMKGESGLAVWARPPGLPVLRTMVDRER